MGADSLVFPIEVVWFELDKLLEDAPSPLIMQHAARILGLRKRVNALNTVLKSIQRQIDNINRMLELDKLLEDAPSPFIMQHAARISGIRKRGSALKTVLKSIQRQIDNMDRMLSAGHGFYPLRRNIEWRKQRPTTYFVMEAIRIEAFFCLRCTDSRQTLADFGLGHLLDTMTKEEYRYSTAADLEDPIRPPIREARALDSMYELEDLNNGAKQGLRGIYTSTEHSAQIRIEME
ncbi:hypothetical protein OROMI_006606 [Orobanche minor]